MLRLVIYAIIFGAWFYTLVWDVRHVPLVYKNFWLAKLIWLTQLNFVVQTIYFGMCTVRALSDTLRERPNHGPHTKHPCPPSYWPESRLHTVCDFVYATTAFPLGWAVCVLFWSLYSIDPLLVMPQWALETIPPWHNHMLHTAPIGFLLVDTLLICHHMPARVYALKICALLATLYCCLIPLVYYVDGFWLYPIFDVLNIWQRLAFCFAGILAYCFLYLLGDMLNVMLWGKAPHAAYAKKIGMKRV